MRRLIFAVTALVALAGAVMFAGNRAEAMPLASGLAGVATGQAEQVAVVCNRVWNGYAWVRSCYRTAPRYYAPRYYAPAPYYYGPRYYRPRYHYY